MAAGRPWVSNSAIMAFFTTWSWSITAWLASIASSTDDRMAAIFRCSASGGISA